MEIPDLPLTHPFYTPPRILSDLLVRNRRVLERMVSLGKESAKAGGRRHILLVGPPGSGKTHILSLAVSRLEKRAPSRKKPLAARLPSSPWGITSFADLLFQALQVLPGKNRPLPPPNASPGEDPARAARLLEEASGGRPLLLVVENLDQVFSALGEEGQKEFRAFLQQKSFTTLLASSRRLFDGVTRRTAPFYGFFKVEHLEPLGPRDSLHLAGKVLKTFAGGSRLGPAFRPEAAAWIRAVQHLSRGNPRFCLLFSLSLAGGRSFQGAFLDTLDRIAPLYLEELRDVSPQQRKILDYLALRGGAVQVKDIARALAATEQTASSQLRDLRKTGMVTATRVGRNSFYEITDPLLRAAMTLWRGEAARLQATLDFLSHWYRPEGKTDQRLQEILHSGPGKKGWEGAAAILLDQAGAGGTLPELGAALVRSLGPILSSHWGEEARRAWREAWKKKGATRAELALPLRLLEAALQEGAGPDSSQVLALPAETREILLPLLNR